METQEAETTILEHERPSPSPSRRPTRRGLGWMLLAVPLLLGGSFSLVHAQAPDGGDGPEAWNGEHGGPGGGPRQRLERVLTAAGATDAQKAQVKTIWEGLRPQLRALHQQHDQLRQQISALLAAATIDAGHIEQLREQSIQTIDKISALTTQGLVQSAGVLTPDQRKQALKSIEEHQGRRGGFRGRGGPGGGAPAPSAAKSQ